VKNWSAVEWCRTRVVEPVPPDELALVPRERKLDVEQIAENVLRAPPVSWIADSAEPEMRPAETLLVETEVVEVDIDPHIEIDRGQALERSQRVEGHLRILLSIDGDDVLAAATQEFVDSEIFDVPAIREIQPWEALVHRAEHLLKKAHSRCPGRPPCRRAGSVAGRTFSAGKS
jgi:hypothetical protein